MSNKNLEAAITILQQSTDTKGALKALIAIRKEVDWPKNRHNIARLRERGCLKQVTGILLTTSQKHVVDMALSILGNCLMDRSCTSEVVAQHNIMSVLNQLLKKYPKEDSINGRTFRVVGNMCQHRDQWATIIIDKKPLIISHLIELVKKASRDKLEEGEKISEATITTALRALRELLNCHTVMTLVKQFGALKAIGSLFIKYSTRWQETKENEKMLLDIVRVIQEYSRFRYYHSIIEMRNTERGDSLVHLSSVLILAPRRITKIVMNFIRSCQLQSELPIPEICGTFVEVLEKHSIVTEFEGHCTEYLQCLCYLLDHPANRNHDRCGRAVPLLIKVLKEFVEISNNVVECCVLLIHTLNKFKYDDRLMLEQLKHGIVPVLVDKLAWLVGAPNVLNLRHASEKKRKYIFGPSSPVLSKRQLLHDETLKECGSSPSSSDDEFDVFNRFRTLAPRSPSPCSSSDNESVHAVTWSEPSSSPDRSLVNESDSDNYSPVCSEADDTDFPLSQEHLGDTDDFPDPLPSVQDLEDSRDHDMEEEPAVDAKKNLLTSLKNGLCQEIVRLVKSYIKLKPPHPHLANQDLLMQLTKCSLTEQFDVKDVICDIIKSHEHLIPLMQTDYIQTLHEMRTVPTDHESCSKCSLHSHFTFTILRRFCETAESGAGKGDIAHKLLRGDVDARQKLVMVIPYIIGNRSILGKLMLNCGGLEILMKLLQENDESDNRRSLKVLVQMASNCLLIANPRKSPTATTTTPRLNLNLNRPKVTADKYKLSDTCSNVVIFEFDDGAFVGADRDFLVDRSEFFNGLLNGHFKESEQSRITLSNVEAKSFRCMLHLLESVDRADGTIEIDLELETLLDVIMLCDRYLLPDLYFCLTDSVEQFRIATETVPTIYNWSVESGTNLLRVESVAYALVASVDERERYAMYLLPDLYLCLTDSVEQFRIATETVPTIYNWSVESGTNLLRVESVAYALVASVDERERYAMFIGPCSIWDTRYLLPDLCLCLTDSVEQFRIATETVPTIYNWSVESGTNLLRVESVAYALVASVDERERYAMFRALFDLGYREQLVEDIQNLLTRYLALSDYNQRVKDLGAKRKHFKEKMRDRLLKKYV